MNSESIHLDTSVEGTSQKVLPEPPLLASHPKNWPSIHAELHRQPPHHTPVHTTSSTILCVHTGDTIEEEWWFNGKYYAKDVSYNQITLYPAYLERSIRWKAQKSFLLLCLQENFVEEIVGGDSGFQMPCLVPQLGINDPFVRELGQLFRQQLERVDEEQPLYIESLSLALGVYLTQHYSESSFSIQVHAGGLSASQVQHVHDYIDSHLGDSIRLNDLAQLLGMSAFHFSRQFKEATRMAPYQYVMRTRLKRAKELLRSQPKLNISDIAFRCGFSNQSHFANHFRKAEGVTPKRYRQEFE